MRSILSFGGVAIDVKTPIRDAQAGDDASKTFARLTQDIGMEVACLEDGRRCDAFDSRFQRCTRGRRHLPIGAQLCLDCCTVTGHNGSKVAYMPRILRLPSALL